MGDIRHRFAAPTPLERLALDFGHVRSSIHLVCAKSALDIPRVRAVADRLARELERAQPRPKRTSTPATRPKAR